MSRHTCINREKTNDDLENICVMLARFKTKQQILSEFVDKSHDRYSILNGILNVQLKNRNHVRVIRIPLRNKTLHSFY